MEVLVEVQRERFAFELVQIVLRMPALLWIEPDHAADERPDMLVVYFVE
jgi:hypothetical protein